MSEQEIGPPPRSEAEEIRRRARITVRMLMEWYKANGISLDVPLRIYVPRGDRNGESS